MGWATIITAAITGLCAAFPAWWSVRRQEKSTRRRMSEIDAKLTDSTTIKRIETKLDRDWEHLQKSDREHEGFRRSDAELAGAVRQTRLAVLRQDLFAHTDSRGMHEHQLETGSEYLAIGGNGSGHVRLTQLRKDYERRLQADDWEYR